MRRLVPGALLASAVSAGLLLAGLAPASAAGPTGPVSATPANTPQLNATGAVEQVRQLVQCGGTMYAVGTFTSVKHNSTVTAVNNAFSFSATAPYNLTTWAPNVNGIINSIAFNGTNCADAYIGGKFTSVDGTKVGNLAEVTTSGTGALVTTFGHTANGQVSTLLGVNGHILAGGYYTSINGSTANPYMTSLDPTTGKDDGFVHLSISGNYQFPGVASNPTRVYNQSLSHGGTLDLVMGDFTSVGGVPRQQIFMLNVATSPATVTAWTSPEWDGSAGEATPASPTTGYPYECATVEPFYIQAAAWSPDDSTIYIGTTGYHPNGWPVGRHPVTGSATPPPRSRPPRARSCTPGSTTPAATRCTRRPPTPAPPTSAGTSGGHPTPATATRRAPERSPPPASRACRPHRRAHLQPDPRPRAGRRRHAHHQRRTVDRQRQPERRQPVRGKSGHAGICFLPYS